MTLYCYLIFVLFSYTFTYFTTQLWIMEKNIVHFSMFKSLVLSNYKQFSLNDFSFHVFHYWIVKCTQALNRTKCCSLNYLSCLTTNIKNHCYQGQSYCTAVRVLVLHVTNFGFILDISFSPLSSARCDSWVQTNNNPWACWRSKWGWSHARQATY